MRYMNELHILAFDVLSGSADDILEMPDTHGLISVQIDPALCRDEPETLFL